MEPLNFPSQNAPKSAESFRHNATQNGSGRWFAYGRRGSQVPLLVFMPFLKSSGSSSRSSGLEMRQHIYAALFTAFIVIPISLLYFDNSPCLTIDTVKLSPLEAYPGQAVTVSWWATPQRVCGGEIIRRIRGAGGFVYEVGRNPVVYRGKESIGYREMHRITFIVPLNIQPGPATFEPIVYRWRNPVQKWWPRSEPGQVSQLKILP